MFDVKMIEKGSITLHGIRRERICIGEREKEVKEQKKGQNEGEI
jgi:hypothetical protein